MKIRQIKIRNFRLLKNFSVDLEDELSLIIGKNNTGKTSILIALEKFITPSGKNKITSDDFNLDFKKEIKEIIISDVEMPLMDGFHFAANVKEDARFKDIPIVFNSSISDHFSEMRGKDAGAEAYLVKFDANLFYAEVARIVRAHMK